MCIFGIYTNLKKDAELHYTRQVVQALEDRGVPYYLDDALAKAMELGRKPAVAAVKSMCFWFWAAMERC